LSDKAKLAYFFLSTHPQLTAIGALRTTIAGVAAELRWSLRAGKKAILELEQHGWVYFSETAPLMWLPHFLSNNPPASPEAVNAWRDILQVLPECTLRTFVLWRTATMVEDLGRAFIEALPQEFRDAQPMSTVRGEVSPEIAPPLDVSTSESDDPLSALPEITDPVADDPEVAALLAEIVAYGRNHQVHRLPRSASSSPQTGHAFDQPLLAHARDRPG
jgi:hypothetical protein